MISTSKQKQYPKLPDAFTLHCSSCWPPPATLLSQPNSTRVSSVPAVFVYHLFPKFLTLQLNQTVLEIVRNFLVNHEFPNCTERLAKDLTLKKNIQP